MSHAPALLAPPGQFRRQYNSGARPCSRCMVWLVVVDLKMYQDVAVADRNRSKW
jgi:hypothetical protein